MTNYSDPKYGLRRRLLFNGPRYDVAATAQSEGMLCVPTKTEILKLGLIPVASDCIFATATTLTIETDGGTDLATFTPGRGTLGTGTATGKSITATSVAAGTVLRVIQTTAGTSGSYLAFIDVRQRFDATTTAD
jgi:hypothetical protein